ncbi:MAG: hypothetical protein ACXWB2_14335 [Acidimicrobiales bacterium]
MSLVMKPVSRPNRRRAPLLLVLVAGIALLAGACKQDNTPSAYNSVTHQNFVAGCTGNTSDNGDPGNTSNAGNQPPTTLASTSACECAYNWIVLNIPYNDANKNTPITVEGVGSQTFDSSYGGKTFESINNDLANNPENMPQEVKDGLASSCSSQGWVTTTTTAASGGPTTVPK